MLFLPPHVDCVRSYSKHLYENKGRISHVCCFKINILGDPGADSGGKGKTKWAEKKWREEK